MQHSSLPSFLPSVSVVSSVDPEEGKNISEPANVKNFLRELSAPLPDGTLGMKVVEEAMGFGLFTVTKILVNKCVSLEAKS